ncbi:phage head-tail connector protein [Streptococcus intermedius]|uniref:phage head-tail connector protein n=1 Tax=Streptococcus intermedius TaxID=1338 RepID=UPI0020009AC1|nr:phage head-tail connector protein [Streptococcus intermedius]
MELEELKKLTGESDDEILSSLLLRAKNIILTEANRQKLTPALERLLPELVLELLNRQGSEGEQSRSEGGVSVSYADGISSHLLASIRNYRLARVSGRAFEKE